MASPVDAARLSSSITTAADPLSVNLPSGLGTAGELLVVYGRTAGAQTFNLPSGWTWLLENNIADATDDATSIIYRWTDGTETSPFSWDVSAAAKGATLSWRITGAENPATQVPQVGTINTGTTGANVANPGAVTPTGGSKDYLFLAAMGLDGEGNGPTGFPTNYINATGANSGTGGAVATNCSVGGASRQLTASTEDPGAFTHLTATTGWMALTVAIHPAAPVAVVHRLATARQAR
jgi:hypothetical protein